MKNNHVYLSVLLTVISCSQAELCDCYVPSNQDNQLVPITIIIDDGVKTSLSGKKVLWDEKDVLSVFDGVGNRRFKTLVSSGETAIYGSVSQADSYVVLYPYDSNAQIRGNLILTCLPSVQTATPGSFGPGYNIAAGNMQYSESRVQIKNACSLVKFSLVDIPCPIERIYLESVDSVGLSGPVKITMSEGTPQMMPVDGSSRLVTMDSSGGFCKEEYCFCVIPGIHPKGLRIIFSMSDGTSRIMDLPTLTKLERNVIFSLGEIDPSSMTIIDYYDPEDDPVSSYSADLDFSKLTAAGHPRLFMDNNDFEALIKRVNDLKAEDDPVYAFHKALMKRVEWNYTRETSPLTHDSGGSRNLLNVAHHAVSRILGFTYAYKVTGQAKYLLKVRSDLRDLCSFPDWDPDNFLCPSEFSFCVAVAYDWLYNDLPMDERSAIHKALLNYELKLFADYEIPREGNINMVTCGAAIATAMVLYEKEKKLCASTIDRALRENAIGVKNLFSPYGVGVEGTGYWEYAVTYEGIILQGLKSIFGSMCNLDKIEGLSETGNWMLYMDGPTGCFNYSDASSDELTGKPGMVAMAAIFDKPGYLVREKKMLSLNSYYTAYRYQMLSVIWLFKNPFTKTVDSFPDERVWSCSGICPLILTRVGWNYDSTDMYCGMKSSAGTAGHSHMDGGSFVFDALGERWCYDLPTANYTTYQAAFREADVHTFFGRKQLDYRWDILNYSNYFHNTLSFTWADGSVNKLHVSDQISERSGSVVKIFNDNEGCGGRIDISELYSDAAYSVFRTSIINGKELIITDDITSLPGHTARFEWRMVTKAAARVSDGYVTLEQNGKTMYLYTKASGDVALEPSFAIEDVVRPSSWTPAIYDSLSDLSAYHVVKFTSKVALDFKSASFRTVFTPDKPK